MTAEDCRLFAVTQKYFEDGQYDRAEGLCLTLCGRYPGEALLHFVLGRCRQMLGRPAEGLSSFAAALGLDAECWDAYYYMGSILIDQARYRQATDVFSALLQHRPERSDAWALLGGAFSKLGEQERAEGCCRESLRLDPGNTAAMVNLSFACAAKGNKNEARKWIDAALRFNADVPAFHMHRAGLLLREGEFEEGWREWEWRLMKPDFRRLNVRTTQPGRWTGESIAGKTLLIWCEQGLGDTIQFVRFLAALKSQGARVLFECQKELIPILSQVEGIDRIFERFTDCPEPFDYHAPLMSLPLHLGMTPGTIGYADGYIDGGRLLHHAGRLSIDHAEYSIGCAWEGSRLSPVNHYRSGTPEMFAPLCAVPGSRCYSLQHAVDETSLPVEMCHLGVRSMAELAGAIASMDLVVTIDTSVAHLAGAMGKPVWLLLSALPDWRWELAHDTTPWYASMRIFRQTTLGVWQPPMAEAAEQLYERCGSFMNVR